MKKTDILTGRIIQRVIEVRSSGDREVSICHGVDKHCNLERLINNLFEYFPNSKITLKQLAFGYELHINTKF